MKLYNNNLLLVFVIHVVTWLLTEGCREGNKAVGICLHVYLERDFLSLESIVYPASLRRNERYRRSSSNHKRKFNKLKNESDELGKKTSGLVADEYGRQGWIEGPELTDHCKRLKETLKCFEDVLVSCDSGYHFFRYRHLLYALSAAHNYLCATAHVRKERFLTFLKTIHCAEEARRVEVSCFRHNVSSIVWNKILRVEVGDEICDSLSTQRSCLLQNRYIENHCIVPEKVEIYDDLSSYFLSIWCRYPMHPRFHNMSMGMMPMMSPSGMPQHVISVSIGIPVLLLLLELLFVTVK